MRPAPHRPASIEEFLHQVRARLLHTGNHFAAAGGASLKDLIARMGHDSERAAIIYQHEARGADLVITSAIDAHIEAMNHGRNKDGDDLPGRAVQAR